MVTGPAGKVALPGPARVVTIGGRQGLAGPAGETPGEETFAAAISIAGHRAVGLDGDGALILADAGGGIPAIGCVRDAVEGGDSVRVYRSGKVNGFAGLDPSEVYYLGEGGLLSLTPPASGILQVIGTAASATELLVTPGEPIAL